VRRALFAASTLPCMHEPQVSFDKKPTTLYFSRCSRDADALPSCETVIGAVILVMRYRTCLLIGEGDLD
jgi:hypothetical protein